MIFKDNAPRFFDMGIPVIPCNGKIPAVKNFQVWSEREQTEDELDFLIEHYPNCNIAVVLGLNLSGIDVDTDNREVLAACQYSPVRRLGKKGTYNFFKASKHDNMLPHGYPIEYHARGRIVVVPPSIHPETKKPYNWIGEEDLVNGFDELSEFDPKQFEQLRRLCDKHNEKRARKNSTKSGESVALLTDFGRNNRLTQMAYAMACDGAEIENDWQRLFEYDEREHTPPWFQDPTEPHRARSPEDTCRKMLSRAIEKSKKRGERIELGTPIEVTVNNQNTHFKNSPFETDSDSSEDLVNEAQQPPSVDVAKLYPKPRGFLREFVQYCNLLSRGSQDILGLGGGITLLAALASNKFYSQVGGFDVWPNVFSINLAYSGFGKETSQRVISELLMDSTLLGSGNYKSGTSIIQHLPEQQERIDVIDECSALLKAMGGREDYKSEIVETLSSLYTKSNGYFAGQSSRVDGQNFGACWNPCVNILGSTTPAGFRNSVRADLAAKGLLPRFLLFYQNDPGTFKRGFDSKAASKLKKSLQGFVDQLLGEPKHVHPLWTKNLMKDDKEDAPRYDPELLPWTDKAQDEWLDIYENYFNDAKKDPENYQAAFKNRFAQHIAKIAMLDALSMGLCEVSVDNLDWAKRFVEGQWEASQELYELVSAEHESEKNFLKVLRAIERRGKVNHATLLRSTRLSADEFKKIIKTLLETERISAERYMKNGKSSVTYVLNIQPKAGVNA